MHIAHAIESLGKSKYREAISLPSFCAGLLVNRTSPSPMTMALLGLQFAIG
jgi:hypothetical protein